LGVFIYGFFIFSSEDSKKKNKNSYYKTTTMAIVVVPNGRIVEDLDDVKGVLGVDYVLVVACDKWRLFQRCCDDSCDRPRRKTFCRIGLPDVLVFRDPTTHQLALKVSDFQIILTPALVLALKLLLKQFAADIALPVSANVVGTIKASKAPPTRVGRIVIEGTFEPTTPLSTPADGQLLALSLPKGLTGAGSGIIVGILIAITDKRVIILALANSVNIGTGELTATAAAGDDGDVESESKIVVREFTASPARPLEALLAAL